MAHAEDVFDAADLIRVECPRCGYVMSVFDETSLRTNKAVRRAYQHALKNPVLCAGCSNWVQRPREVRSRR